jgi:hypothetical protein
MSGRLKRIEGFVLSLTTLLAAVSFASGVARPLGIVLGGMAVWLDFVVIKGLAAAMLTRTPARSHLVPMALAKTFILVALPAIALFLPGSIVNGVSFAVGVTTLPVAIVADACLALPAGKVGAM